MINVLLPNCLWLKLCLTLPILLLADFSMATEIVVFEDDFNDNDITSNSTGTGQLFAQNILPGNVTASESGGRLVFSDSTNGTGRESLLAGPFTLNNGFRLSFEYEATGNENSQTLNIGLFDDPTDLDVGLVGANIAGSGSTGNGIGFGALARNGLIVPGLIEQTGGATGASTISTLQTNGLPALDDQTVSGAVEIIFNADSSYSFSANGLTTFGTLPSTSGFTLNDPLSLLVITQGSQNVSVDNLYLSALEAVPEPSSLAILGLLGLGAITCRRRS